MAEPFVFHFRRAPDGHPEQMYLADIQAECTLCGQPQMQRFYHATDLHSVTLERIVELARAVPAKTDYECPNCGSHVGPEGCVSAAFTWAFPDDAGLMRGFLTASGDQSWQLIAERRLDPQALPGWNPDPELESRVVDELDDAVIEEVFDRPLNPKQVIAEELQDWLADPEGGAVVEVAGHTTLLAAGPDHSLEELRDEVDSDGRLRVSLADCVPSELPTHRDPAQMSGRLESWLRLESEMASQVELLIDPEPARQAIERAFAVANLTYETQGEGAALVFSEIKTPREQPYPRPLPLSAVLRRAAYTGMTPGDAARLTAEEVVGTLLRVW